MVKLTLSFNNKFVNSLIFDKNVIHIGRNSNNDLSIDHPAAAPIHAVVKQQGHAYIITQIDSHHPLIINNEKIKEARLINNDKITIDHYSITFNSAKIIIPPLGNNTTVIHAPPVATQKIELPNANVQILSGQHIGRVISLKKKHIGFGQNGSDVAVISRQREGYSITAQKGKANITINSEPLGDSSIILNDNDMLVIDNISMQFFLET